MSGGRDGRDDEVLDGRSGVDEGAGGVLGDHGLLHAYAVDAVDPEEARAFEAHLGGCPACRAELVELREALDAALADDAALVQPPAALRARVMDALDDVAQLAPLTRLTAVPDPGDVRSADPRPAAPGDELSQRRALRRARPAARTRWLQALATAAAVVVVAGAAVTGYAALQWRGEAASARQAALSLAQVASAPDAVTVSAQGDGTGAAWTGTRVMASRSLGEAVLVPSGVGSAPEGSTYQLWYVTGDAARSAGTFDDGDGAPAVLDGSVAGADAVAVTLEPAGGSSAPTSTPVAVYPLGA